VFPKNEDAEYIVKHLDSHMGATTECLQTVLKGGKSVTAAVDGIVKEAESGLIDALIGKSCGQVDRFTYIVTAHLLFESLHDSNSEVDYSAIVEAGAPGVDKVELDKAVDQLTKNNLIGYVDSLTVSFHSRRLKWAYHNVRDRHTVKNRVAEALIALSKQRN